MARRYVLITINLSQMKSFIEFLVDERLRGVTGIPPERLAGKYLTAKRVQDAKSLGLGQTQTARMTGLGLTTIKRHWNLPTQQP